MTKNSRSPLLWPIYPFLVIAAPILSLFSANSSSLYWLDLARPLIAYGLLAALFLAISRSITENLRSAALLAVIPVISWVTYGRALGIASSISDQAIGEIPFLIAWAVMTLVAFSVV